MNGRIATACYREIGAELRKVRQAAGFSEAELSRRIGWSTTKVSRVESGHSPISQPDLIYYVVSCGMYLPDAKTMLAMCREGEAKLGYWFRSHDPDLRDPGCTLLYHEATASASITYEPRLIPGLLQTEAYTRVLALEQNPNQDPEPIVRTRQDRKQILHRPKPGRFTFFLHEQTLRVMVGDRATMHEQVLALLLLDGLPHVAIRVVPHSIGANAVGGAFRLFEFTKHAPLVYLDAYVGGLFLEDGQYVDSYRALIPHVAELALSEGHSREYFAKLASDHDRERAEPDAHNRVAKEQLQRRQQQQ